MNLGKLVKGAIGVAATVGATALNPALGAVVGSALGGGASVKAIGKRVEKRTGHRPHKVGAPVAAAGAPAALIASGVVDAAPLCEFVMKICESPALLASSLGALTVFGHQLTGGVGRVARSKS
jgi:hypothetical protein